MSRLSIQLPWAKKKAALGVQLPSDAPDEEEETRYKPLDWKIVRRLFKSLKPYRKSYIGGILLGLIMTSMDMTSPFFIARLVDYSDKFLSGLTAEKTTAQAIRWVSFLIALWFIAQVAFVLLDRARIIIMTRAGETVQFDIRQQLFKHLQRLSMSYYDKTKLGRIISRCTSDVNSLREVNVWGIDAVVINFFNMFVAAACMMFYTGPRLFFSVAWLAPVLYFMNRYYLRKSGEGWQMVREGFTRVSTNLAENITGVRVVTAFNRQSPNLDEFNRLQVINTSNNISISRLNGVYQPALMVVGFIGKVIILAFGGYLVVSQPNVITVGAVVAAFLYWDRFMGPIIGLGNWYNIYLQAMAGGERVFDLLDTPPDIVDQPDAIALPRIEGRVEFQDVVFGYNPDRPVLHGVSFKSQPGQMIALVGATGSGKSSIISLIARFYQPQQGRVLVDGYDIRQVLGDSLHKQMGLVLQVNYLFTGTVMENIRYARPGATDEDVIQAAKDIGSYDAIMTLTSGFQTEVGERGGNMSLGQRQLICFTRAFLADPRIFMLDEATSAVDTATELQVQRSLEKLLEGRTTFVVAHRLSTIKAADMILVIEAGQIIERGTHKDLVTAGGKYAHLYEQFVQHSE